MASSTVTGVSLTPDDLRRIQFARSRRGYDADAVDGALQVVAESLESVLAERQELLDRLHQLQSELDAARLRGDGAGSPPPTPGPEVDAIRADAERDAALQREIAHGEAATIVARAREEADRILAEARSAAERLLRDAKELAEHAVEEARTQATAAAEGPAPARPDGFTITEGAMPPEAALLALLGESRAVRSLLEMLLDRLDAAGAEA